MNADKASMTYKENEILVKFKEDIQNHRLNSFSEVKGLNLKESIMEGQIKVFEVGDEASVNSAINAMMKDDMVEYAQPNYIYKLFSFPADEFYEILWGLHNTGQKVDGCMGKTNIDINAPEAWGITKGRGDIIVAVIDNGIDIFHPDLKDNIWENKGEIADNGIDDDGNGFIDDINGWDFTNEGNSGTHGTHVAGTIAAAANDIGVIGVAPNIRIMSLKAFGVKGGTTKDVIDAIEYAAKNGAQIVNCSWGGEVGEEDKFLKEAISDSGLLFICAAGNDGNNNDIEPVYPASYKFENVISVAAIDNQGEKAGFSNYGNITVDIGAPGRGILSTVPGVPGDSGIITVSGAVYDKGSYAYISGTSMAAPHVAGIAALLLSKNPDLAPEQIKTAIMEAVKPLDGLKSMTVAEGIADAFAALKKIAPEKPLNLKTVKTDSCIGLTWDDNKTGDFDKYIIERKKEDGTYMELAETSENSFTDMDIDVNIDYSYRIKAEDEWGNISEPSKVVTVKGKESSGSNSNSGSGTSKPKPSTGGGGGSGGSTVAVKTIPYDNADDEIKKQMDNDSDIIEIKSYNKENIDSVSISSDILNKFIKSDKVLYIKGEEVTLQISSDSFAVGEIKEFLERKTSMLNIEIVKLNSKEAQKLLENLKPGYISLNEEIYEIKVTVEDSKKSKNIEKFNKKVTICIKTDEKSFVRYLGKIGIYRYNEETKAWSYEGGLYNPENNFITISSDHFSKYTLMVYENNYDDIKGHWAEEDIELLISKHIADGRNNKFEPDEYINRIELVKMLAKMLMQDPDRNTKGSEKTKMPFKDLSLIGEDKNFVNIAVEEGIINGFEDGTFRPLEKVSREEMAAMIARMMKIEASSSISETPFSDKEHISSWVANDVAAVYEKGIIKGDEKGNFDGKRAVTRAEAVVMIRRIMDNLGLIELPTKIKGKLTINHIEGTHFELITKDSIYVLIIDKNDSTLNKMICDTVGKEVIVKGYVLSGYSIYQRGKMFKVIELFPQFIN